MVYKEGSRSLFSSPETSGSFPDRDFENSFSPASELLSGCIEAMFFFPVTTLTIQRMSQSIMGRNTHPAIRNLKMTPLKGIGRMAKIKVAIIQRAIIINPMMARILFNIFITFTELLFKTFDLTINLRYTLVKNKDILPFYN